MVGNAAGGINRGVAVAGDRVFMVTDHAHLIALNRFTGEPLWDVEMADWRENYNATAAPLPEDDTAAAPAPAQDPFKKEEPKALDGATTAQAGPAAQPAAGQPAAQVVNKVS